ncbi:UNVERIFIED_CONTAM: hypothetical protein Cloal_2385 [Acetivibrio alkalicellulosi]
MEIAHYYYKYRGKLIDDELIDETNEVLEILKSPKCSCKMKIIAFIEDGRRGYLIHLNLWNNHDPLVKNKTTACGYSYLEQVYYEDVYNAKYEDEFSQGNPYDDF